MCWEVSLEVLVTMNQLWAIDIKTNDLGCTECYQQVKGGGPSLPSGESANPARSCTVKWKRVILERIFTANHLKWQGVSV